MSAIERYGLFEKNVWLILISSFCPYTVYAYKKTVITRLNMYNSSKLIIKKTSAIELYGTFHETLVGYNQ